MLSAFAEVRYRAEYGVIRAQPSGVGEPPYAPSPPLIPDKSMSLRYEPRNSLRKVGLDSLVSKLALLAILALSACSPTNSLGSAEPAGSAQPDPVRAATLAELIGPWRREPLSAPAAVIAAADRTCRRLAEPQMFPRDVELVAIDARGGGRLPTTFASDDAMAYCGFLTIADNGILSGSLSGSQTGFTEPVLGPGRLLGWGGTGSGLQETDADAWCSFTGRAGPGVARVVIEAQVAGPIMATLQNGWYVAWWPVSCRFSDPLVIAAYDVPGRVTDQIRQCWIEATFFACPD